MTAPVVQDRLADLRDQVEWFRSDLDRATARLASLTAASPVFHRSMGETARIKGAQNDLHRALQGLRNSERLLRTAEELWSEDGEKPP